MTERRINLDVPDDENEPRVQWLMANDIDPLAVPALQEVLVTKDSIAFVEFLPKVDGVHPLHPSGYGYRKRARLVPLVSAPENFGL